MHAPPLTDSVRGEVNGNESTCFKKSGDMEEFNFYDVMSERTLMFMLKRKLLYREKVLSDIRNCTIDDDKDSKPSMGKKFKPSVKEGKNFNPKFFYITPEGRTIIKLVDAKYKIQDAALLTPNDRVSPNLDFKGSVKSIQKQKYKIKKQNRESLLKPREEVQFSDNSKSILGAIPTGTNCWKYMSGPDYLTLLTEL
ncbi:hypothetical protein L1987_32967 [Smallanthus sonchifolius]|uniref:Uncharacterized protein n=1 Tax=Smallanthus sonchifolius TaxID=185202 RepID=A0ACB9HPP1_9ASTR|nr:hypothetical protein L1987_32967 [Smallanthus sonchifolius]